MKRIGYPLLLKGSPRIFFAVGCIGTSLLLTTLHGTAYARSSLGAAVPSLDLLSKIINHSPLIFYIEATTLSAYSHT